MGFAPIKWTCTAFFRPRQLTDRAILANRQTQEKKMDLLPLSWTNLQMLIDLGLVMDLSDHTDCCGSECKLFHLGACSLNSPHLILADSGSNVCHAWTVLLFLSMGHCILAD